MRNIMDFFNCFSHLIQVLSFVSKLLYNIFDKSKIGVIKLCKICGNKTFTITIDKIEYSLCDNCGFLAKTPNFIPDENEEYSRYLLHDNDQNDGYISYQEKFYNDIKNFLGKSVLDYGCGNNHILSDILEKNGFNSSYYDLYFYPNENYKKARYDAIILEEVIEHLSNPLSVLKELIPLLNEGGNLVVRTQFVPTDFLTKKWWYFRDITHISFFNFHTFEYLSKLLSLQIIYCNEKDLIILKKV